MVGAGAVVFAVMGYVIAKQVPSREVGSQVRLNPILLAAILGESPDEIKRAIEFLCSPDDRSTTKKEGGRRLKKLGEFDYQVINGAKYRAIRDEETRLEQNRDSQRRFRDRQKSGSALPGEKAVLKAEEDGVDQAEVDRLITKHLPQPCREDRLPDEPVDAGL